MQHPIDLPNDIVGCILQLAELPIDTRLALKVPPTRLVTEPSLQTVRDALSALCERRVKLWKTYLKYKKLHNGVSSALESVSGSSWPIGPRRSMCIQMEFLDIDEEVRMATEVQELVDPDPADPWAHLGGELFVRRAQFCIVHTGVRCSRFINDTESGDE